MDRQTDRQTIRLLDAPADLSGWGHKNNLFYQPDLKPDLLIFLQTIDIYIIPESLKAVSQTKAELKRFLCCDMTSLMFTGLRIKKRQRTNLLKCCQIVLTEELDTINFN